jgi:hypothetical protein
LVLESNGVEVKDKPFEMIEIDIEPTSSKPLRINSFEKGDGLNLMNSDSWNSLFPPETLLGISRTPIAVCNSIVINYIIYGD